MKKFAGLMVIVLLLSMLAGCAGKKEEEESASADSYVEGETSGGGIINGESNDSDQGGSTQTPDKGKQPEKGEDQQSGGKDQPSKDEDKENNKGGSSEQKPSDQEPSKDDDSSEDVPYSPEESLSNLFKVGTNKMALSRKGQKVMSQKTCISAAITVKQGDRITLAPVSPAQVVAGICFDKNGKVVEMINSTAMKAEATFPGGWKIYTYAVPKNGASVQWNIPLDMKDHMVVARNHVFTIKEHEKLSGTKSNFYGDCLYEKRSLFVGDSICVGSGGWAERLAISTGMEAVNNGVSGSSLSTARDKLIIDQLLKSKDEDFDYVLIHGGVNDAWESAEVGFVSDSFDPNSFDESTYAGGLEWNLYNAVKYYGDTAAIGYLMNFKMPAAKPGRCADMSEYFDVAKEICEKWGVTYFDMYNHDKITKELDLTTSRHTYDTKNFVHISASGYDIITPYIEEYMRGMTACTEELLKEIL